MTYYFRKLSLILLNQEMYVVKTSNFLNLLKSNFKPNFFFGKSSEINK